MKFRKMLALPLFVIALTTAVRRPCGSGLRPCRELQPDQDLLVVKGSNRELHLG